MSQSENIEKFNLKCFQHKEEIQFLEFNQHYARFRCVYCQNEFGLSIYEENETPQCVNIQKLMNSSYKTAECICDFDFLEWYESKLQMIQDIKEFENFQFQLNEMIEIINKMKQIIKERIDFAKTNYDFLKCFDKIIRREDLIKRCKEINQQLESGQLQLRYTEICFQLKEYCQNQTQKEELQNNVQKDVQGLIQIQENKMSEFLKSISEFQEKIKNIQENVQDKMLNISNMKNNKYSKISRLNEMFQIKINSHISTMKGSNIQKYMLLFMANKQEFKYKDYQEILSQKSNIMILLQLNNQNQWIGCFSPCEWNWKVNDYQKDKYHSSCIFQQEKKILLGLRDIDYAMKCQQNAIIHFGQQEFIIDSKLDIINCKFGKSYQSSYNYKNLEEAFLGKDPKINEIYVYQLIFEE